MRGVRAGGLWGPGGRIQWERGCDRPLESNETLERRMTCVFGLAHGMRSRKAIPLPDPKVPWG